MEATFATNFDWLLRVCDHARYHEDSVYMGITKTKNPAFKENLYDYQPQYIYGSAWFLDACGFELCYEIIDTSHTIRNPGREMFRLSSNGWGFSFRFESPRQYSRSTFQNRGVGDAVELTAWGDPAAFERAKALLDLVLPLREKIYYDGRESFGMVEIDSPWTVDDLPLWKKWKSTTLGIL